MFFIWGRFFGGGVEFGFEGWIKIGGRDILGRVKNISKSMKKNSVGRNRKVGLVERNLCMEGNEFKRFD